MDADILLRVGKRHKFFVATKRTARRMAEILGLQRLHDYILVRFPFLSRTKPCYRRTMPRFQERQFGCWESVLRMDTIKSRTF